jgi:hypothetical protein
MATAVPIAPAPNTVVLATVGQDSERERTRFGLVTGPPEAV